MKLGKWPIGNPFHQSMLDRIPMHIIHMMFVIGLVANNMLPKTTLSQIRWERIWTHCAQMPCSPLAIRTGIAAQYAEWLARNES